MTTLRTILHVINTTGPGGAETVCVDIARKLDPSRWRSIVVVPEDGWIAAELRAAKIETIILGHRSRLDVLHYAFALSKLVRVQKVAIIQSHLFGPTVLASAIGAWHRIPVIGTFHGEMDVDASEHFKALKFVIVRRLASQVVFVSERLRQVLSRSLNIPRKRTVVIPNGTKFVDAVLPTNRRECRDSLGIGEDEFVVGAIGNLRAAKGYDIFIRAAAELVKSRPGYRFVIAGEWSGALGEALVQLRDSLGLRESVTILGFRSNIAEVLGAMDICAVTSRSEGFSLVTVEAMAFGLPIVATRCGGPEAILEHERTGLLVENESPTAVARAVTRLRLDAQLRARLGASARTAARTRFNLEAQVTAYEELYLSQCTNRD